MEFRRANRLSNRNLHPHVLVSSPNPFFLSSIASGHFTASLQPLLELNIIIMDNAQLDDDFDMQSIDWGSSPSMTSSGVASPFIADADPPMATVTTDIAVFDAPDLSLSFIRMNNAQLNDDVDVDITEWLRSPSSTSGRGASPFIVDADPPLATATTDIAVFDAPDLSVSFSVDRPQPQRTARTFSGRITKSVFFINES